ncbi:MAG: hypothetical protein GY862_08890, partial [Gammaproteobacteria bacterium]|nr:hypothetical protein [Gammaproteobacteria bacterium]
MTTAQCLSRRGAESETPVNCGHPPAPQKTAALAKLRSALQNMQHALNLTAVTQERGSEEILNFECRSEKQNPGMFANSFRANFFLEITLALILKYTQPVCRCSRAHQLIPAFEIACQRCQAGKLFVDKRNRIPFMSLFSSSLFGWFLFVFFVAASIMALWAFYYWWKKDHHTRERFAFSGFYALLAFGIFYLGSLSLKTSMIGGLMFMLFKPFGLFSQPAPSSLTHMETVLFTVLFGGLIYAYIQIFKSWTG